MIVDRHGFVSAVVNTLETDPAGVLINLSGALGTAGKVAKGRAYQKQEIHPLRHAMQ